MISTQADMSAYPVIRIDHIPFIESKLLEDSVSQIIEMIESMNADEGPKPPLLFYLSRQLESMRAELLNRDASDRINCLLAGVELSHSPMRGNGRHSSYSSGDQVGRTTSRAPSGERDRSSSLPNTGKSQAMPTISKAKTEVKENNFLPKLAFTKVLLPSELAWQESSKSKLTTLIVDSPMLPNSSGRGQFSSTALSIQCHTPPPTCGTDKEESNSTPITPRSPMCRALSTDTLDDESKIINQLDKRKKEKRIPHSAERSGRSSRRNSIISHNSSHSHNDSGAASPNSKAQAALYKDFGTQFLVAGTEKKLRFFPDKLSSESMDDVRERDRSERRKMAMKRLVDRRENQQKRTAASQLKKRQERLVKEENWKKKNLTILTEKNVPEIVNQSQEESSEDDESVSGGEEDDNILDQVLLKRVTEAVERVEKEHSPMNIYMESKEHSSEVTLQRSSTEDLPLLVNEKTRRTRKGSKCDLLVGGGKGGGNNSDGYSNMPERRGSRGSDTATASAPTIAAKLDTPIGTGTGTGTVSSVGSSANSSSGAARKSPRNVDNTTANITSRTTNKGSALASRASSGNSTTKNEKKSPTNGNLKVEKKSPAGSIPSPVKSPVHYIPGVRSNSKKIKRNLQSDSKYVCTTTSPADKGSVQNADPSLNNVETSADLGGNGSVLGILLDKGRNDNQVNLKEMVEMDEEKREKNEEKKDENIHKVETEIREVELAVNTTEINLTEYLPSSPSKNPKKLRIMTNQDSETDGNIEILVDDRKEVKDDNQIENQNESLERSVSVWDLLCNQDELSVRKNSNRKNSNTSHVKICDFISIPKTMLEPELIVESNIKCKICEIRTNKYVINDTDKITDKIATSDISSCICKEDSADFNLIPQPIEVPIKPTISNKTTDEKKEELRIESDKFINEIAEVVEEGEEDDEEEVQEGEAVLSLSESVGKSFFDLMNSVSPAVSFSFSTSVSLSQFPTLTSPFRALQPHSSLLFSSLLLGNDDDYNNVSDEVNGEDDLDTKIVKRLKVLQLLNSSQTASPSPVDVVIKEKVKKEEREDEYEGKGDEIVGGAEEVKEKVNEEKFENNIEVTFPLDLCSSNDYVNNEIDSNFDSKRGSSNNNNVVYNNRSRSSSISFSIRNSSGIENSVTSISRSTSKHLLPIMATCRSGSPRRKLSENKILLNGLKSPSMSSSNDRNDDNGNINHSIINNDNIINNKGVYKSSSNEQGILSDNTLSINSHNITSQNNSHSNTQNNSPMYSPRIILTPRKEKLSDTYSHIGMIFPVTYKTLGSRQCDGYFARSLLECMQFQGKLYTEWMDVMGDYATVFTQDRGFNNTLNKNNNVYNNSIASGCRSITINDNSGNTNANSSSSVYQGNMKSLHYRVKASVRPEVYNIVSDVFNCSFPDWNELPSGLGLGLSWNLLWTWSKPRLNSRVNHFEGSKELTRKDLLKRNIKRYTDMSGKSAEAFEIMPLTFQLPHEYTHFVKAFVEAEQNIKEGNVSQNFWIMKPVGMSRGRGIVLVNDVSTIAYSQTSVIQKYVENPLCLDDYKFDLRLYVLVTSFKPLEAFIYTDGFARVSTDKYSLDRADIDNKFIHLTNSSIQKMNEKGIGQDNPLNDGKEDSGGSKISLKGTHGLWSRLQKKGIDTEALWKSISLLVLKSLIIVDDKMSYQPCSFEVFGYDVLVDTKLRCWLIEVNSSPSMARENNLDIRIKNKMIQDTISLIAPAPYDREAVAKILKKRYNDILKNKFIFGKNDIELESDLKEILGDFIPRKYGEEPKLMGSYEQLCPNTKLYTHVLKLKSKIIKTD